MTIRFENVHKSFGAKKVLDGISFEAIPGEVLFIIGKSGAGKSITLKHIVGLIKPDSGKVIIDEVPINEADSHKITSVRSKCGIVFQHPALLDSLTVYENVSFGLRTPQYRASSGNELSEAEIREIVLRNLRLVHLSEDIFEKLPSELSYGMQKRVSIARTLSPNPTFLLFDEPTTGLDPIATNTIDDLIRDLSNALKLTSLVVSHDMASALRIADRILFINDGKLLEIGTPTEIRRSTNPFITEFLAETIAMEEET